VAKSTRCYNWFWKAKSWGNGVEGESQQHALVALRIGLEYGTAVSDVGKEPTLTISHSDRQPSEDWSGHMEEEVLKTYDIFIATVLKNNKCRVIMPMYIKFCNLGFGKATNF
jgi:hypothetical protein